MSFGRLCCRLSLRAKAMALVLSTVLAALTVVAIIFVRQMQAQAEQQQHASAQTVVAGIGRAAEVALAVQDRRELTRVASSFLRDPQVSFIAIYGTKGQLLAHAVREEQSWSAFKAGKADQLTVIAQARVDVASAGDEFDPAASDPVSGEVAPPGAKVEQAATGRVAVGISTAGASAMLRDQMMITVAVTSLTALVAAIAAAFFVTQWTRRLGTLVGVSDAISRGEFDVEIPTRSKDEIGHLSKAYDSMRNALRLRDAQLREFNGTLQQQVQARTAELRLALEAAEEASRTKSLFLANMSHELRTPLNGVIGMVDLLLSSNPSPLQKRYGEVARASARALLDLISDILDFSKIEAGKVELDVTEFDLVDMIEGVTHMLSERAATKGLELICAPAPGLLRTVKGDEMRLRQVLSNLMSNAIKFTERGEVMVRAWAENEVDGRATLRFEVHDTGIGISAERVDRLFKSFSQVDASTTRKFGGTGLGLAISSRIVEMMNGRIGVESKVGAGSMFWFTVTLECKATEALARRPMPVDPRGLRTLVVDDSAMSRQTIRAQLGSWGVAAEAADSAQQALMYLSDAAYSGNPFRLAIIDVHLPGIDGLELARRIRLSPEMSDVILISLSSLVDSTGHNEMRECGFAVSLSKPVLPSSLYDGIVDALASTQGGGAIPVPVSSDEPVQRLDGMTALLAEDNEVNQLVATEIMTRAGCVCEVVGNGRLAVEAVAKKRYDFILMDCQMPEMDGFEATRGIRAMEEATPSMRRNVIIALTANAIKGDRERCLAAGMDGYCSKPVDPSELLFTISALTSSFTGGTAFEAAPSVVADVVSLPDESAVRAPMPAAVESQTPPIDVASLRSRCMGNRVVAAKAIQKFEECAMATLEELGKETRQGNAEGVAAAAHKIKGSAANISAEDVREVAARIEELARNENLGLVQCCISELEGELMRLRAYMTTAMEELRVEPLMSTAKDQAKG